MGDTMHQPEELGEGSRCKLLLMHPDVNNNPSSFVVLMMLDVTLDDNKPAGLTGTTRRKKCFRLMFLWHAGLKTTKKQQNKFSKNQMHPQRKTRSSSDDFIHNGQEELLVSLKMNGHCSWS